MTEYTGRREKERQKMWERSSTGGEKPGNI